ncbi:ty1-copia retrotransposon protein [Cucumis melo var. makuwa]|uniref:Ty1-copia retrotransposon protein n=1 Tax=Cucumis melo var. makuwa TaxID=1194695 RepID=A0A5A7TXC2_CUCMM|nr:ty1-copia retrotransposon protein [Cucumis melo var. makuwa]TYK08094.1 ty1-copia retrotransposon protein [Cucumis melo var. makuwa]
MKMCQILQANVLLEKFPSSWNDYRNDLKHKKKDLKLQELISHMPIVEANLIENKTDWILDTGASRHFCINRELLHDYEDTVNGECVIMENSATAEVIGKGKVILKLKIVLEGDKVILTKNREFVGKGYLSNGLFVLNTIPMNANTSSSAYVIKSVNLWHGRLGHVNFVSIRKLKDLRLINTSEANEIDLADFKNTTSRGGKNYYVSCVDDYSRFTKIYLMKTKDEAGSMFLKFKAEFENQLGKKIKRLRSNRGGEYSDKTLKDFCESNDIIHEFIAPYSPQQNGIAERKNRTLKEMMNVMLLSSDLSDNMWGKAALSSCFVLNKIPRKRLDKTPYELWKGHAPNLSYLKVWDAWLRFMCLNDKTINESRDAEFFEHVFPLKESLSIPSLSKRMHDPENPSIVSETPVSETVNTSNLRCELELRRSKRQRTDKSFGPDFLSTFIVERRDEIDCNFTNLFLIDEDPKTYQDALNSVESSMWKETIKSELDSLVMNHTWDLVDLPMGNKPIRYNDEVNSTSGSTMESEFIALELAGQEAEWIKNLLGDVPLWETSVPVSIQCDSQAAICTAKNSVYNGKSRHIRLRHVVVKQLLKEGTIFLEFVRSEKNLADPLTK